MANMTQNTQRLMKKIQSLPNDQIVQVEDFVDALRERKKQQQASAVGKTPLEFPVDDLGPWPEDLSLRREDLYGDDGR